jgi:hypothetical protein
MGKLVQKIVFQTSRIRRKEREGRNVSKERYRLMTDEELDQKLAEARRMEATAREREKLGEAGPGGNDAFLRAMSDARSSGQEARRLELEIRRRAEKEEARKRREEARHPLRARPVEVLVGSDASGGVRTSANERATIQIMADRGIGKEVVAQILFARFSENHIVLELQTDAKVKASVKRLGEE